MKLYKIRHKVTKQYSKSGTYVPGNGVGRLWTDEARSKSWDTIGKLRAHLTMHMNKYHGSTDMSEWEVVEYETQVVAVKPVHEIVTPERLVQLLKA